MWKTRLHLAIVGHMMKSFSFRNPAKSSNIKLNYPCLYIPPTIMKTKRKSPFRDTSPWWTDKKKKSWAKLAMPAKWWFLTHPSPILLTHSHHSLTLLPESTGKNPKPVVYKSRIQRRWNPPIPTSPFLALRLQWQNFENWTIFLMYVR